MRYPGDPATLGDIPNVVDFARQILDMQQRIEDLEEENDRLRPYEKMYHGIVNRDFRHAIEMENVTLKAILDGMIVAPKRGAESL